MLLNIHLGEVFDKLSLFNILNKEENKICGNDKIYNRIIKLKKENYLLEFYFSLLDLFNKKIINNENEIDVITDESQIFKLLYKNYQYQIHRN